MPAWWAHSSAIGPPDVAHDGCFTADVGEKRVQRRDHLRAFADSGGNALHRPGAHVTDREDPLAARLERPGPLPEGPARAPGAPGRRPPRGPRPPPGVRVGGREEEQ